MSYWINTWRSHSINVQSVNWKTERYFKDLFYKHLGRLPGKLPNNLHLSNRAVRFWIISSQNAIWVWIIDISHELEKLSKFLLDITRSHFNLRGMFSNLLKKNKKRLKRTGYNFLNISVIDSRENTSFSCKCWVFYWLDFFWWITKDY